MYIQIAPYKSSILISLIAIIVLTSSGCSIIPGASVGPLKPTRQEFVETADGWSISIQRFGLGFEFTESDRMPIVLCHGLGYNDTFWTLTVRTNFARYLYDEGFDVWLVSLRGAGASTKPGMSVLKNWVHPREGEYKQVTFRPSQYDWSADDYIQYDIPAVIDFITKATGKEKVVWVGHSLGGMIMYAYLATHHDDRVLSMVSVGTPLTIPQPPNLILRAFSENERLFKAFLVINTRSGATGVAPFHKFIITPDEVLLYNKHNVTADIIGKVLTDVVEDIPPKVIDQVLNMVRTGSFLSYDKSINYTARINEVTIPLMICSGKADNLAPPETGRYLYDNAGSNDKSFALFGTANGDQEDYGHNDLILGKYARYEVYPKIIKWLKAHSIYRNK